MHFEKTDVSELATYFRETPIVVQTRGIADGTIFKFHDYYLKVYDDDLKSNYDINQYMYHIETPLMTASVPKSKIKQWIKENNL